MSFLAVPAFACENTVHLWRFRIDQPAFATPRLRNLLSPDEMERARRFRFEAPRRNFVASRIALRAILGAYLGADARGIAFVTGAHGKPALGNDDSLQFNLSHSGGLGVLALTRHRPVGCDIEALDERLDIAAVATHFFSGQEQAWVAGHADAQAQRAAFYAIWVCKEAYLKGIGTGLTMPPASFTVGGTARPFAALPGAGGLPWHAYRLALPSGYDGALAIGGAAPAYLHAYDWRPSR